MKAVFKSLVGVLAAPLALALMLAIIALALRLSGRRKLAGGLFVSGLLVGYLGSLPIIGDAFLAPLEGRYPPFDETTQTAPDVRAIVVLGSWYEPRAKLPVTAALSQVGVARIAEGVRLAQRFRSARLVVSGGPPPGGFASALGYERFAREFGLPVERLVVLPAPRDTAQEARELVALLGRERFILVTSASHMPRAMVLMERHGARPVPAPTANQTRGRIVVDKWRYVFLPNSGGLEKTELAWHEYVGLAAIALHLD